MFSLPVITFAQGGLGDELGDAFGGGGNNNEGTENTQKNPTEVPISGWVLLFIGGIIGTAMFAKARKKANG